MDKKKQIMIKCQKLSNRIVVCIALWSPLTGVSHRLLNCTMSTRIWVVSVVSNRRSLPSNMRKQPAIELRRPPPKRFFVTAEVGRIDENNIVEMRTNYTSYQKIPRHWFHLPEWGVTKIFWESVCSAASVMRSSSFLLKTDPFEIL